MTVENKDTSLRELLVRIYVWKRYLVSKWLIIIAAGVIGAVVGLGYSLLKTPDYVATSTFVLEDASGQGGMGQYMGLASMVGIDLGGGGSNGIFQGENILELYKSRTMLEKSLLSKVSFDGKDQLVIERYIDFNGMRESWKDNKALSSISFAGDRASFSRVHDSLMAVIVNQINKENLMVTKPDKKLNIIKVQVTAKDEQFAKVFNNKVVDNVNNFYLQTKTKKSLENVEILRHQTDSIRAQLNSAISGVASSIDVNPNANAARQILRVPSQRRQIDAEANKAILTELVKNLELAKVSLRKETPLIQIIDSPIMPLHKNTLGKTKALVVGAVLFAFLTTVFLLLRFLIKGVIGPDPI